MHSVACPKCPMAQSSRVMTIYEHWADCFDCLSPGRKNAGMPSRLSRRLSVAGIGISLGVSSFYYAHAGIFKDSEWLYFRL